MDEGEFRPGALNNLQTFESSLGNKTTVFEMIQNIRNYVIQNSTHRFSFELSTMSNTGYITLTGISEENFEYHHSFISNEIRNTQNRGNRMSLGIFPLKLRSGMSNTYLQPPLEFPSHHSARQLDQFRQRSLNLLYLIYRTTPSKQRQGYLESHKTSGTRTFWQFYRSESYCCF